MLEGFAQMSGFGQCWHFPSWLTKKNGQMIYTVNDDKIWIVLQVLWWTDNDHLDHPNTYSSSRTRSLLLRKTTVAMRHNHHRLFFKKKQHLLISSVDINCLGPFFRASFGHFYMITQLLKFKLCIFPISTSIFFQPDSKQNANTQALAIISSSSWKWCDRFW